MKLQNIIMPSIETYADTTLYFRSTGAVEYQLEREKLILSKNATLSFDTYFNGFSLGKWKTYSKIHNLYITLQFKGKIKVTLVQKETKEQVVKVQRLKEVTIESDGGEQIIAFGTLGNTGMCAVEIEAISISEIYGGYYWTDIKEEEIKFVKIALNICTFKREEFVRKNVSLLKNKIFNNSLHKELKKCLEIFIIDNAKTLEEAEFQDSYIHLFPNQNAGGAGGFTRGLLEIQRFAEEKQITHALLMDDDIFIEPESIFRTWTLLSLRKDCFEHAFVGGAMLRIDDKYLQVESGAIWNQGTLISRKSRLDLRNLESCLYNETEEKLDYSAWWYTTIPLEIVHDDNLPIPIFIRGDDVEYGLRMAKNIIMMNGICVWHEPFENKYSSAMFYYILRNRLIVNAIHGSPLAKEVFIQILSQQIREEVYLYRYKNAHLLLDGVEDYLKSIDWLKNQNGEILNKQAIAKGYQLQPIGETTKCFNYESYLLAKKESNSLSLFHKIIRRLSINGILLSTKKENRTIPLVGCKESSVYRVKHIVHYDALNQKGFITKKDKQMAQECLKRFKYVKKNIHQKYNLVNTEYQMRSKELTNKKFWIQYLGIQTDKD